MFIVLEKLDNVTMDIVNENYILKSLQVIKIITLGT